MPPPLSVTCTGSGHNQYIFRVKHEGGCEWTVRLLYSNLLDLHARLSAVFVVDDLPTFPPQLDLRSACFGESREVQEKRVATFQSYFDKLCVRSDIVSTAAFQAALGIRPPKPVKHLRVRRWMKSELSSSSLLDIVPDGQEQGSPGVVERYHIVARIVVEASAVANSRPSTSAAHLTVLKFAKRRSIGGSQLHDIAELQVSAHDASLRGAWIEGLPLGAQIEFEVVALNALGRSSPVTIRSILPPELLADSSSDAASVEASSMEGTNVASAEILQQQEDLRREVADLSVKLEEKEQEVLDLQFDMAALTSRKSFD